ncbi:MAG TPA: protein kinase [Anaerolineales bacterium]|nr:protein kinase [Anaerolineales bacterium]
MHPDKIGRYKIKEELGQGEMGAVYRAFDPSFNREVAIKVLPLELMRNLKILARFRRELKMIALLEHPAIVPVYDVGEDKGQPYYVMRYMSGGSLRRWINGGKLSLQDTADIVERIALGLEYAHRKGIVHRDLTPDNILFDNHNIPYITDFSLAKLIADTFRTNSGNGFIGTPEYISPEQAQSLPVDHRTDIYGLGVIAFEMLTGEKPYKASDSFGVLVKHVSEPVPEILNVNPELPQDVDAIIKKSMAKNRNDRYESAVDMARALIRAAYGDERTLPSTTGLLKTQNASRSSRRWGLAAIATVAIFALAGLFAFRGQLPFFSTPSATPTTVEVSVPVVPTLTPMPTVTPTVTATVVEEAPTPILPAGSTGKVALLSGNDLYLMNPDGSELTLVRTDNSPKSNLHWTSDGRLIYMSRNCAFMLDSATNRTQQIVCFNPNENLEGFRVSPDGKYAAISIQRTLNILPFDLEVLREVNTRFNLIAMKDNCFYNQFPFRDAHWSDDNTQLAVQVIDTQVVNSDQVFLVTVDIPNCATTGLVRMDRIPGSHIEYEEDSNKRIVSYDWDGDHMFLLNDSIRNDGFGNLYMYNSDTKESVKLNPIDGECCYRDARWSPDGQYIFFAHQKSGSDAIELYYISLEDLQDGQPYTAIELPAGFFSTPREKPQPALQAVQ